MSSETPLFAFSTLCIVIVTWISIQSKKIQIVSTEYFVQFKFISVRVKYKKQNIKARSNFEAMNTSLRNKNL